MKELLRQEVQSLRISHLIEIISSKSGWKNCSYCGCKLDAENRTKDHVIPRWLVSRFSSSNSEKSNLGRFNKIPCCHSCNHEKAGYTLSQWKYRLMQRPVGKNLIKIRAISRIMKL